MESLFADFKSSAGRSLLYINSLNYADSGEYFCVAENNLGNSEDKIKLNIRSPPKAKALRSIVLENSRSKVQVACFIFGNPYPVTLWFNDYEHDEYYDEPNDTVPDLGKGVVTQVGEHKYISVLTVPAPNYNLTFHCNASNDYGNSEGTIYVVA